MGIVRRIISVFVLAPIDEVALVLLNTLTWARQAAAKRGYRRVAKCIGRIEAPAGTFAYRAFVRRFNW